MPPRVALRMPGTPWACVVMIRLCLWASSAAAASSSTVNAA